MTDNVAALLVELLCVGGNVAHIKLHCIDPPVEAVIQPTLKVMKQLQL